ncbi:MAG: hypothetical protein RJQ00_10700 [Vicingaceae bacterium]
MPKKRILIVGLPLFAKRVKTSLEKNDRQNSYVALDTYYRLLHKIIAPYYLISADVIYSINGTIGNSKLLDWAFKLNKKVVMHWVGSDVTTAINQFKKGEIDQRFLEAKHLTDASWLKEELKPIGINAKLQYISGYTIDRMPEELPKQFAVLSYIPKNRADFYGRNQYFELAENFPDLTFYIVGSERKDHEDPPENIVFKGWVSQMDKEIDRVVVTVRFVKHDGMSQFVLESLARGRYVLYNYDLDGSSLTKSTQDMVREISRLKSKFDSKELTLNQKGIEMIKKNFSPSKVLEELKDHLLK